ncbi:unnamed protein product [Caenorhabditis sp. 36 PRJEB53466]|nr:unnamed protein product [Caenorhabditis sp. 36 PRJEB53466]
MMANGNSNPAFRRQASTAGVNPVLTVALSPVPKVDYSVTKGGARTWIVLLVFIFLCSSLYTIFSAKDIGESHHDLSGQTSTEDDDTPAYNHPVHATDNDDDDDDDDDPPPPPPPPQRVSKKQEQQTAQQKSSAPPQPAQVTDSDDEDDEESNEHTLGGRLFAGLRKKITDRLNEKTVKEEPKKQKKDDKILNPREARKLKKQQKVEEKKVEVEEDDDDEDDEDDDDVKVPASPETSRKQKAYNQKEERKDRNKKYQPVKEEPDLDDDDDNEDDEDDDDVDDDDEKGEKNDSAKDEDNDEEDDEDDEDDDDDDDEVNEKNKKAVESNNEDEDNEPKVSHREAQRLRRQHMREARKENRPRSGGKKECIHQDCPDHESLKPRKSLLLKKKKVRSFVEKLLEDEFDDDDEDDEDENNNERNVDTEDDDDDDDDDERLSDRESSNSYKRHAITTKEEIGFRDILDRADHLVEKHDYDEAMELFDHVIAVYPSSTRAYFGKARAYDIRGEIEANETDRDKAIEIYEKILHNNAVPEALFRQAAQRLIEKTRFRGHLHQTLNAHRLYIDRFPEELNLQTDFAISFVMMKRYEDARTVLRNVLANDPNHVMALAYYGYILKAHDDKVEQGVALMRKSLKLSDNEISDPKFYYQLGHGLTALGKKQEADAVYQKAAQMGVFMTAQQRSLYNIEGLTGRAWWNMEQTPYSKFLKTVERQWATIRQEGMEVLKDCSDCWLDHNQQLVIDGQWKYFPIMSEQNFIKGSCERMPQTCLILQEFSTSSNASKSEMYLSVLSSGASILPHCGPTNYHLQAHLGLVSPSEARIRVGNETKGWRSGKFIIFDESFEHELQFDGASSSSFRLVLVLQLWHPEVQPHQRVLSFLS